MEGAVRSAVLELLVEGGYEAVSFREVAARAGVGQPTVYRRWATKAELVEFAVFAVAEWAPPKPSGNLEKDLKRLADAMLDGLLAPAIHAALAGLTLDHYDAPEGQTMLRAWAEVPVFDGFAAIVEAAGLPGNLKASDLRAVFDSFLGSITYTVLTREASTSRKWAKNAARISDRALRGLAL
ncbi:MAG TPA: TetR/AcrR family transcriptional regulator [Marmoricola sp.]|nr:TetR/AcrR family transcriptional regulator [Marmoricola sp.]